MAKSIEDETNKSRLWIGNLDPKLREYQLLKIVEKYGPLVEFDFLYHRSGPQNGQPRGYAFVTYKALDSAKKAQCNLDGLQLLGRKLAVKWAHAQDETKYLNKTKPVPPILGISGKEGKLETSKTLSKSGKIAALEAQLKMLGDKNLDISVTPDIGGPSNPTSVIYNYIEKKSKSESIRHDSHPYSKQHSRPKKNCS